MTSKYHNQPTQVLLDLFDKLGVTSEKTIVAQAGILFELKTRGVEHVAMKSGTLRWYKELVEGKLTPLAVITFGGVGSVLRKMTGMLPPDFQDRLARGEKLTVPDHGPDGKIIARQYTILQLTMWQLDIVFGDNGVVRSYEAQKKLLAARGKDADIRRSTRAVSIRADVSTGEIVCGHMRIAISDPQLISAISDLGFTLVRKPKKPA